MPRDLAHERKQHMAPRPFADIAAELLENLLRGMLEQEPDDTARKHLIMDLRARGAISDEMTAMAFYWFPGCRDA